MSNLLNGKRSPESNREISLAVNLGVPPREIAKMNLIHE